MFLKTGFGKDTHLSSSKYSAVLASTQRFCGCEFLKISPPLPPWLSLFQELSSNGSLESARSSIDSFEDAKENGYVEISKMSPHVKKTTGSSGNRSTSFRGSDNQEENWECMSAMSVGMETWLVQEWCEMGSLDRQVERGLFMIDSRHLDMVRLVHTFRNC